MKSNTGVEGVPYCSCCLLGLLLMPWRHLPDLSMTSGGGAWKAGGAGARTLSSTCRKAGGAACTSGCAASITECGAHMGQGNGLAGGWVYAMIKTLQ